ncbi:MAG TPA: hypothetical protein DCL54_03375 [Alphaproteobacteria bacterium]|nr:hypothetical protein [Alphaproteobacteria bacterium]
MTLTDTTLAEIEAAARAATEGPWQTMAGDPLAVDAHSSVYVAKMTGATPVTELAANARFITLACNNAAAMAAEIRALREAYLTLQMALSEAGDDYPGSSMQEWCVQQIARAEQIRKGTPP